MTDAAIKTRKTRLLFIEDSVGLSGSTMSLCHLLARLDLQKFELFAIFSRPEQQAYWIALATFPVQTTVIGRKPDRQERPWVRWLAGLAHRVHPFAERLVRKTAALLELLVVTIPYCARILWFCRRKRIDLIHHNNGCGVAVVLLGWVMRVPVMAYQRGPEWISPMTRQVARQIPFYCANSQATRQNLLELGVPSQRIEVVYPPVELLRFDARVCTEAIRRELDVAPGQLTFGIVGNLSEWKGQRVFLRAAKRVLETVPQARAFIIGGASRGREAYERELHGLAHDLAIDDRVTFTGFRSDVPELLKMLDVVVHASVRPEPFGRVIVEAMAMAKPVVATGAGGPLEIIRSEENGFLVPPGDHDALAESIIRILRDPLLARAVGARALLDAEDRFSASTHVVRMQEIYLRVTRGQSADRVPVC